MLTFTNPLKPRLLLLAFVIFCAARLYAQVPSITSFSPLLAPSGASVTITGTNFSATAANNAVYFGNIKATVTAASTTSLSVQVPVGAPNERISVTVNGKTVQSMLGFRLVFPGGTISSTSFNSPSTYILRAGTAAFRPVTADLDGDGLAEMVSAATTTNGGFYVARNISTPGNISFSAPQSYTTITAIYCAIAADVDGDGLLDLVFSSTTGVTYIVRNTSTSGIISFATPITVSSTLTSTSYSVDMGDLNNDGFPELVFSHSGTAFISIFQNTSTIGNISFMAPVNYSIGSLTAAMCVAISDLDQNGYNDIIVSGGVSLVTLRNTSASSVISFESPKLITGLQAGAQTIKAKDITGDLLPEILVGMPGTRFNVFENNSVNGNISLGVAQNFFLPGTSLGFDVEDVNGDGANDVITMGSNYISVFPGTGVKGSGPSSWFLSSVDYYNASSAYGHGGVFDLDKDGRKDIYNSILSTGNYQIRRFNNVCQSPFIYVQPKSFAGCAGLPVTFSASAAGSGTVTYQWRKNGLTISGANSPSYSIAAMSAADTGTYTLVVSDSCVTNGLAIASVSSAARLMITGGPFITSHPVPVQVCGGPVSFTADAINAGNMRYQWRKNGINIGGATNAVYTILNATAADSGNYSVMLTDTCGQTISANAALSIVPIVGPDVTDMTVCSPTTAYSLYNNASTPTGYETKWYDDANFERLIGIGYSMAKIYPRTDTVYARHEYINSTAKLIGVNTLDNNLLAGDDRSSMAMTQRYLYYTGDSYTVRYDMPGLTNGVSYSGRDALFSTYNGSGSLYSFGSVSAPWGYYTSGTTTHIWRMDSVLNPVPGSAVALNGVVTSLAYGTARFIASGPDFILYRVGNAIYKINPSTGFVSLLTGTASTFAPLASEGWSAWGHVELVNNNHYIYYKSTNIPQGITRYHVESNTYEPYFNPSTIGVFSDMAALLKSPWNNKWYFKFEVGTVATGSLGIDEVIGYCDDPVRLESIGCISPADTIIVTSTIPVFGTLSQNINVCSGSNTTISYNVTPSTGLDYYWYKNGSYITNTTAPSLAINPVTFADSGKYVLSIYNGCATYNSDTTYLRVRGINITSQPQDRRNCQGEPVSLSVTASGSGTVTYQWRKNNVNISSANSPTYNIASLAPSDTGTYTVIINDSCNTAITSAAVKLSISVGPTINTLSSNMTACVGNAVSLSVSASGNGTVLYQWRKNGTAIPGANSATYIINSFVAGDAATYSVAINDNCGQTISGNISLTQQTVTAPVVIDRTFCSATTTLTHTNSIATPGGYITRWYDDDSLKVILGTGTSISKFYTGTDTIYARNEPTSNVLSGAYTVEHDPYTGDDRGGIAVTQSYYYYVGDGNTVRFRMPGLTNPVSLPMRDGIIATYGGTGTVYSLGSSSGPWGTGIGSSATHIWALDSNLDAVPGSGVAFNGVISSLATSSGLMVSGEDYIIYQNANSGFVYKINPSTGTTTILATSSFNLSRYSTETWASWGFAEKQGTNHYITYRSGDGNLSKFHVEGNTSQVIFTESPYSLSDLACISYAPWYNRLYFHHEGSTALTASSIYSETAGYCDAPMRFANTGCYSAVDTIFVVAGSPAISAQPQSQVSCAGGLTRFIVRNTGSGVISYQWRKNGISISGATDDTLTIVLTSAADSGDYSVVITNTCGSVTSNNARLSVKGVTITTQPVNIRNCMGEPVSLSVVASGTGTLSYQWRKNGVNVSGGNASTYSMVALSPLDTGTYNVWVRDSCNIPVASVSVYVGISTGPSISNLSTSTTLCRGSSTTVSATVSGNGTITYQWRRNGSPISGANSSSYTINNLSASDTGNYVLVVNDNCGQTISSAINIGLLIVTAPEVNNNSVCNAGNSVSLTNTIATPSGYTTKWYDNAGMTILLGSGPLLVRTINAPDTFYVRNENATATCVSATDTVYVTITSSNTWTGASNTNWFNATNWSCGVVPNSSTNALIPSGTANSPVINNGLTANVNSLTINSGATVSMLGASFINIYGTLTRTGTLSCPAGTVTYANTTTAITIAGGDYYNLSVAANASGATLTGNVKLYNTFSFAGNTLVKLDVYTLTQYNYTSAAVTGAGTSAYFVTNKAGSLRLAGVGTGASAGTSAFAYVGNNSYNPLGITNSGTIDTFVVRVIDSVTTSYSGLTPTGTKITSNVINRSWAISEETAGGSTLTLLPGWTVANEMPSFNRANCYVARYGPTSWVSNTGGAAALNGSVYLRSQAGISAMGIFGVGSNGALPVQMISFTAQKQSNNVLANWATSSEINNDHFMVEVSADGQSFVTLDKVKGNGNSNSINQYRYLHVDAAGFAASANTNTLYYRLTQVDFDGTEYETEIVPVSFAKTSYQVSVSPNPFIDHAMLSFSTDMITDATITLTDVNGKQISQFNYRIDGTNGNQVKLENCEKLNAGVYFVHVMNANGEVNTFKLVKQ